MMDVTDEDVFAVVNLKSMSNTSVRQCIRHQLGISNHFFNCVGISVNDRRPIVTAILLEHKVITILYSD